MEHIISCEVYQRFGLKYFHIYEIRILDNDGVTHIFDRYLSRPKAEEALSLILDANDNYKSGYVLSELVWIG